MDSICVCNGCNNDLSAEEGHQDCPNGCLHDKSTCDFCLLVEESPHK